MYLFLFHETRTFEYLRGTKHEQTRVWYLEGPPMSAFCEAKKREMVAQSHFPSNHIGKRGKRSTLLEAVDESLRVGESTETVRLRRERGEALVQTRCDLGLCVFVIGGWICSRYTMNQSSGHIFGGGYAFDLRR